MVKEKNRRLKILMNGELVGWLSNSSKGILRFVYDESWLVHNNAELFLYSFHLVPKRIPAKLLKTILTTFFQTVSQYVTGCSVVLVRLQQEPLICSHT